MLENEKSKSKCFILLVEDAPDILELMRMFLESEGFGVATAENGADALRVLKEGEVLPSVIFLDMMMPKLDGFGFKLEQAKDARISNIPVVLMTAGNKVDETALKIGAQHYLKKPLDINELLSIVQRYCH